MAKTTRATQALQKAKVDFEVHTYDYDPNAANIGEHAAASLGVPAGHVLKTLMTLVDGKPVCVVVPSDGQASMKKIAAVMRGKAAAMMPPAEAERVTGYLVGGISPFGQKRPFPTIVEESALALDAVFLNGGGRGVQVRMTPRTIVDVLGATVADVLAG